MAQLKVGDPVDPGRMCADDVALAPLPDAVKRCLPGEPHAWTEGRREWRWTETTSMWGRHGGEYAWRADGSGHAIIPTTQGFIVVTYTKLDRMSRPTIVSGPFPEFEAAQVAYLLEVS